MHAAHRHLCRDHIGRKAAALEFGIDIRARPNDDVKAEFTGQIQKGFKLREIKNARLALVMVPENVGVDRVEAGLSDLDEAVSPGLRRASRIRTFETEDEGIRTADRVALAIVANDVGLAE